MESFEKHLAREEYNTSFKEIACKRRIADRQITRKERRARQHAKMNIIGGCLFVLLFIACLMSASGVFTSDGCNYTTENQKPVEVLRKAYYELD